MRVKISPSKLNINPKFIGSSSIILLLSFMKKTRFADLPLERCEKNDIGARRVHFIAFSWMNSLLLNSVDFQTFKLHVVHLTQIHDNTLMNFLPQMSPEDLNK